jgi:hypothetical protein
MTYNQSTDSTQSTTEHPTETKSVLSRRELLKHAALTGIVGISGKATATNSDRSTENTDSPSTTEISEKCCNGKASGKVLRVKGTGNGDNSYHIETSDSIKSKGIAAEQQETVSSTVAEGNVRQGSVDTYCYTGKVTTVWARGSVTYYVSESPSPN